MVRALPIAVVQQPPLPAADAVERLRTDARSLLDRFPRTRMVICPELHLFDVDSEAELRESAEPLTGPRVAALGELAAELGVWLLPGTVCECEPDAPGAVYNTALAFSPRGRLVASYRKIF